MLLQILRGGDMMSIFVYLISTAFVVFCTLPVHEFAHGWMANKMGDPTARLSGRLTLNPMKHLDLIGAILIFLTGLDGRSRSLLTRITSAIPRRAWRSPHWLAQCLT